MPVLPDVLQPGLAVVFVGTAASKHSAETKTPYSGPGNSFWRVLHEAGFTPEDFDPQDFRILPHYGIGLTNMAPASIGNDDVLTPADFDPDGVHAKVGKFAPRVVAFVGKRAAQEFFRRKDLPYGRQTDRVGITEFFVLPSTSGAARRYWDPTPWHALAAYLKHGDSIER